MCGIVGIWNLDDRPIDRSELDKFTDSLSHRGPDGRGIYLDSIVSLGLGHRRLSILDLTPKGQQPMSYANGRYWITHNGELYNFIELQKELTSLGYKFKSNSDTEVILAAYVEWGEACQLKFNGMWAFAIWDAQERVLFLSRDRFGVKPLHYLYNGKQFIFASEMKSFLTLNKLQPSFDKQMVDFALRNPYLVEDTENCLLKGIKRLNGGCCLTVRVGQSLLIERWWDTFDHLESNPGNFDRQIERFKELFFDACNIRMRSDVPLATALSGGLDSSSVLCTMTQIRSKSGNSQRLAKDWQKAFVATFKDTFLDERKFAEKVIRFTDAKPIYKEINSLKTIEYLDDYIFDLEEIYEPHIGTWLIYREMRNNNICISMDGHGGDEALAGYSRYSVFAMQDAIWPKFNIRRWFELKSTLRDLYPKGINYSLPTPMDSLKGALLQQWPETYKFIRSIYQGIQLNQKKLYVPNEFNWLYKEHPSFTYNSKKNRIPSSVHYDILNRQLYIEFHHTILPTILRNFDRLSMAHGVEIRAPFMDWRLVCSLFSLPSYSKIGKGFTKRILREAMRNILPESIRVRTDKIGFMSPMEDWYRGLLKPYVLDSINSKLFLESDIWNGPLIRNFVEDAYLKKDYQSAAMSWKYIHASRLMQLFKEKSIQNGY